MHSRRIFERNVWVRMESIGGSDKYNMGLVPWWQLKWEENETAFTLLVCLRIWAWTLMDMDGVIGTCGRCSMGRPGC